MSTYTAIKCTFDAGVATVSLNRPGARNGYTPTMAHELERALKAADADPAVRVVVLTSEGPDFSVGADLSGGGFDLVPEGVDPESWQEPAGRCSKTIYGMDKPVIAALRGVAVGGGITITLSCDFRLASTDSRFSFPFSRRGIFPEGASVWYLPRLVGMTRAADWMLTGRLFGAQEALDAGLVTSVHEPDQVLEAAHALARDLIANTSAVSTAVIRQMLNRLSGMESPYPAHAVDSRLIAGLGSNPDAAEGVASFLEKRAPRFPLAVPADLPPWLPWRSAGTTP
ncbi:enoyl-CoA hydratase/carnithine racemase [Arthrobacter silviterrae]|uniref:Enoyl-CoA hydratase n=1 Tax=Arthrobacter silviterrae TaxID=2026658 RepID=A0ABX0DA05_9MICC|nr:MULTISPECIES: enoyl-CoA hydratase-related protein [Arthrobacter]MCU6480798.1 enoyl-CoA hydratase-related protein [Arthrobacter sp. A2-55]MDQ0277172.1 enoyl-CoA hydratase/carnithine racemase [Arthrobacter silviterrae]NGN83726.1 enoyl-CoA hydratase [Arthrobacter silviterrae]